MEKFEEDLAKLKDKINSMTLSDEFKDNLVKKLDMEYERMPEKKRFFIPKQIVAVFACCVLITGCACAGRIGDTITNLFANTSKEFEQAIESGEMKSLNTDYVERDGLSIKIDYAMVKDDSLYLVLNVSNEEIFDYVNYMKFIIQNENDEILYNTDDVNFRDVQIYYNTKSLSNKEAIVFLKLTNIKNIQNFNNLNIIFNQVTLSNSDASYNNTISNNWNFDLKI